MIVIADASPLRYLVLIQEIEIIPALYGRVLIPSAVFEELTQERTPESVRRWIAGAPGWLEVRTPSHRLSDFSAILGAGERQAIALAEEMHADVLLVDDWAGRREAVRRSLTIQGTLGLLGLASQKGLTDLPRAVARLQQTDFRANDKLIQAVLDKSAGLT